MEGTSIGNRPLGTLRRMWEEYIIVLLRKISCDRYTDVNRTVLGVFKMTGLGFIGDEPSGLLPEVLLLKIFLSGLMNFKFSMVCLLLFVLMPFLL